MDHIIRTYWGDPPTTKEQVDILEAKGFTVFMGWERNLHLLKDRSIKIMLYNDLFTASTLTDPDKKKELDDFIARVKDNPAVDSYYICDEPAYYQFFELGQIVAYLKKVDPSRLSFINLFPTYTPPSVLCAGETAMVAAYKRHLDLFMVQVQPELLSFDHYYAFHYGDDKEFIINLEFVRESALAGNIPFMQIIQSCSADPESWRMPTSAELNYMTYATIAYGGLGICFFCVYWDERPFYPCLTKEDNPIMNEITRINFELKNIESIMTKLTSMKVYHTTGWCEGCVSYSPDLRVVVKGGQCIVGLFGDGEEVSHFMVVDKHTGGGELTIEVKDCTAIEEYNKTTGEWLVYSNDPIHTTLEIKSGEGRLFRLV